MTFTFALNTLITIALVLIPYYASNDNRNALYICLLLLSGLYGSSVALLQVTLYGIAGFSAATTSAFMVGIGLSAMIVNLLRILLLAVEPD